MTEQAQPVPKPVPEPDEASMPFFDGAKQGRLMIRQCTQCQEHLAPERVVCTNCLSDALDWIQASGQATVHTFGIMHQRYHPGFAADIPYNVAIVELEEGPRLNTNLVGIANEDIRVGMQVSATFEKQGEVDGQEVYLPKFRPAA